MSRYVLLSFDVEEFDMPLEYNRHIALEEQLSVSKWGTDAIETLLQRENVSATLFTTVVYAHAFAADVRRLAANHEIASHTWYHSQFEMGHLEASRLELQHISGKKVTGLRMPRMKLVYTSAIQSAGYTYDASVNPVWLPGRYNNLHFPRTSFRDLQTGLLRIPASSSPRMRLPLFWLAFKNYPYAFFKRLCLQCLKHDGYLSLYFHPWEFADIRSYNLPGYVTKDCGEPLLAKLRRLIEDLKQEASFITMDEYANLQKSRVLINH